MLINSDQQREFEAARRALEALCQLRDDPWHWHPSEAADPELAERVRWLLIRMGLARGTPWRRGRRPARRVWLRDLLEASMDQARSGD